MNDRRPIFHWPREWTVDRFVTEAKQLIAENNTTLMWRTASRLTMAARGVVQDVRAEESRPTVVALAKSLVAPDAPPMNDAAFVFYCNAVRVEGVDAAPLRKELASDDPFRKVLAAEYLAHADPPDPMAIPILDELLRFDPKSIRWKRARARYDDQREAIA